jgi:glycosyltransferase involved in cell wall biosynthesis
MIKEQEKYNIICLSNQLWDFPNWTNKRHVMTRLAKDGHNVLFVDPPLNFGFVFWRQVARKLWGVLRIITQVKKDGSGALVYTPINLLPYPHKTVPMHINRINKLAKKHFDPSRKTILWVYHVQLHHLHLYLEKIIHDALVYDCVDNYEGFPQGNKYFSTTVPKEKVLEQEQLVSQKAQVVFATAPGLVEKLKQYNSNVHFTPNVGDYGRFKNVPQLKSQMKTGQIDQLPEDIKQIPRPRIGYIGALDDYKFDYDLLKKIATDHTSYSFVVIGPRALKDKEATAKNLQKELGFENLENVYFLGSRPYDQKENYLAGFDVDIIPYVLNDYTVGGCFPVKFHDSLAAGLPVVVTDLPAYAPFKDVCYISKSYDEFSENIKNALDQDSYEKVKQRQLVAKENNWDGKVEKMLGYIGDVFRYAHTTN